MDPTILTINFKVVISFCQSSVEAVESFLPQKESNSREICDVLLAGDPLGVPQHSHHRL